MPSYGERNPEKDRMPHPYEKYPQPSKQINPGTVRKVGEQAVKGVQKDKGKK